MRGQVAPLGIAVSIPGPDVCNHTLAPNGACDKNFIPLPYERADDIPKIDVQ